MKNVAAILLSHNGSCGKFVVSKTHGYLCAELLLSLKHVFTENNFYTGHQRKHPTNAFEV